MPRCSQQLHVYSLLLITLLRYLSLETLQVRALVNMHMCGTSVRHFRCMADAYYRPIVHGQLPYCEYKAYNPKPIEISSNPDLSETLSPVSSAPMRVCLCDMNGRPQCARFLYSPAPKFIVVKHLHCLHVQLAMTLELQLALSMHVSFQSLQTNLHC